MLCFVLLFLTNLTLLEAKPNFILILTDDQDSVLGGMTPLKNTRNLFARNGIEFQNMFVTTSLCCPSRASILTGKYAHNHGVLNNSISGNCNSLFWQQNEEPYSFVTNLKKAGYFTFYSGKYLNQYGKKSVGGTAHIPPGWDYWIALVGNSCYYNYSLSVNGKMVSHGADYKKDYFTDVVMREAVQFINNWNNTQPFFMFISPPAPHAPFTSAPQYQKTFANLSAPRTPNFNVPGGKHKHWLLQQPPSPLPDFVIQTVDEVFRNRWQTLLSVDDGIVNIFQALEQQKLLDETFVIFTSDNGFHLGQFSLPWDKRQPYEFDVRVPLFIRGPGIKSAIRKQPVLNIDLAPTILKLSGLSVPSYMDGVSFDPYLYSNAVSKRNSFVIEHKGEASNKPLPNCPQYQAHEVNICEIDCICEDSWNNTYVCVRELSEQQNTITCLFKYENFVEAYNLTDDPYQMKNIYFDHQSILFSDYYFHIK